MVRLVQVLRCATTMPDDAATWHYMARRSNVRHNTWQDWQDWERNKHGMANLGQITLMLSNRNFALFGK